MESPRSTQRFSADPRKRVDSDGERRLLVALAENERLRKQLEDAFSQISERDDVLREISASNEAQHESSLQLEGAIRDRDHRILELSSELERLTEEMGTLSTRREELEARLVAARRSRVYRLAAWLGRPR